MNHLKYLFFSLTAVLIIASCSYQPQTAKVESAIKPVVITDTVEFDTDDPAIWINPADATKSLIVGTDKETNGGLYVFDLQGKIVNKFTGMMRPNNVDVAYGFNFNGKIIDIAATTERERNRVRIFSMPDLKPIDGGGLDVFSGEKENAPMGIAFYKRPSDNAFFLIVGRKDGPEDGYLWQYRLGEQDGKLTWNLVRKFGKFSGKKEIEAIAVDNELGYVYYCDEQVGVRKYYADPDLNNNAEMALFGTTGFKSDHEGISIYKTSASTGYILVSNQQANSFMIYPREGDQLHNRHYHRLIAEVPVSTNESDGSEVTPLNLGPQFPQGLFVAMSNGKVFHYYDWRDIAERAGLKK